MRITTESKAMMIRQILARLEDQRDRIERIDDGNDKTRALLADYQMIINHYQSLEPALFNAQIYPEVLDGLREVDHVIAERERFVSTRDQMFIEVTP